MSYTLTHDASENDRLRQQNERSIQLLEPHWQRLGIDHWESALDVGCGPGFQVMAIARLRPDITVTGVDLSAEVLDDARQRAAASGLGNCSYEVMDAQDLDYPDNAFSYVQGNLMLEFVHDPAQAIAEMCRVLKPGGHLFIQDLDYDYHQADNCPEFRYIFDVYVRLLRQSGGDPHIGRQLYRFAKQNGMTDIAVEMEWFYLAGPHDESQPLNRVILERFWRTIQERAVLAGLTDERTFGAAREHVHAYLRQPLSFAAYPVFYLSARKPDPEGS